MDTYANMQAVGIEPPRMRGLDTDPALAPAAATGPAPSTWAASGSAAGGVRSSAPGPMAAGRADMEAAAGSGFDPYGLAAASTSAPAEVHQPAGIDMRRSAPAEVLGGSAVWRSASDAVQQPGGGGKSDGEGPSAHDWRNVHTYPNMQPGHPGGSGGGSDGQRSVDEAPLSSARGTAAAAAAAGVAVGAAAAGQWPDGRGGGEAGPPLSIPSPAGSAGGGGGVSAGRRWLERAVRTLQQQCC